MYTLSLTAGAPRRKGTVIDGRLIALRIRKFRKEKDLSLEKLAAMAGLTKGYLSRIENSAKAPPVFTLARISKALDTDINRFFSDEEETCSWPKAITINRKDRRHGTDVRGTPYGCIHEALADDKIGKNMQPFIIYSGFERPETLFQHEGEEFILILDGRLKFLHGNESFLLEEGDSLYFDANIPHYGISLGEKPAKALGVIYSYKRL
jgi:transcriptional regulator with XRE-family HTH domain